MKDEAPPEGKTPHERFVALGKRVMAVPRSEVTALDKKWKTRKRTKSKPQR